MYNNDNYISQPDCCCIVAVLFTIHSLICVNSVCSVLLFICILFSVFSSCLYMPGVAVDVWPDHVHSTALMAATSIGSPTRSASSVVVSLVSVEPWPL